MLKIPKRFSLRLLITLVSASALAFAYEAKREAHRRHLVEAIVDVGGEVAFADATWTTPFPTRRITTVTIPYMSMDRFSDEQLSLLVNLRDIIVPDVQCPCPGEIKRRKRPCLVPMVLEIPLAVPTNEKELLNKIRGRQDRLSAREVQRTLQEDMDAKTSDR